jgi:hypothetical protein
MTEGINRVTVSYSGLPDSIFGFKAYNRDKTSDEGFDSLIIE